MERIHRSQVLALKELGFGQGTYAIDAMHKREMALRTRDLCLVDRALAGQVAQQVGGRLVDFALDSATEWAIAVQPLRGLTIYFVLQRYSPEFEDEVLTFYGREVAGLGMPVDDLYDFTRLCANALVRAARSSLQGTR
ncbi:MAG: hypothetical protein ACE14S_08320 [Candidatus Bathyarchaeia archaeon]